MPYPVAIGQPSMVSRHGCDPVPRASESQWAIGLTDPRGAKSDRPTSRSYVLANSVTSLNHFPSVVDTTRKVFTSIVGAQLD